MLLDPLIKTHILVPITVIMVLVHFLRREITIWATSVESPLLSSFKVRQDHHLARLRAQRSCCLCPSEFQARKLALERRYADLSDVLDPEDDGDGSILDKLRPQMTQMILQYIPQPLMLWFMSQFFSGYIVVKLPFHLTSNFKEMLHNSITGNVPDLNVEYVTAISWFFTNLLGVKALAGVSVSLLRLVGDAFGVTSRSYLDSSPREKLLLANLQNVHSILSVGGMSSIPQPMAQPMPTMVQPEKADVFKSLVQGIKQSHYSTPLTGIQERFISTYH